MVLDLERFDLDAALVLLFDGLDELFDEHVGHVVHVTTALETRSQVRSQVRG